MTHASVSSVKNCSSFQMKKIETGFITSVKVVIGKKRLNETNNICKRRLKLACDSRFQRAFTACSCVFKVITLV